VAPSAGFRRYRRIADSAVFRAALATRPRLRGSFFDILCLPSATHADAALGGKTSSRLGLVVPKRICRSAARRNWIKRMVRESFRREMPSDVPFDCVIRLRRMLERSDAPAARIELGEHWRRVLA